jgi:ketosteroid isomerase-like protein
VPAEPLSGHAGLFPPDANAAVLKPIEANAAMAIVAIEHAMTAAVVYFLDIIRIYVTKLIKCLKVNLVNLMYSAKMTDYYTSRKQFLDEAITPLSARLSKQITPKVRALYADGDTVIALWDGTAVAKDGKPYNNTYSWYMTMKNGRIVKAVAFFDTLELADIWQRIPI